ncbi:ribosomal protein L2 [Bradyrhizobium sp. i1.7.7]
MALKKFNPTTPGQRQLVMVDRSALYKGKPVKALTEGKHSSGGRNNTGRITVRFRGGGHKQTLRIVDFKRDKVDAPATVERLEYDPNRTAFIALVKYEDGTQAYILAPQRLAVGDSVVAGNYVDVKPGNVMPLGNMPVGTIIHNIEVKIGKGGQLARSAGTYAQLVGRDHDYVIIRLNSGEQRLVHGRCRGTIGAVSNPDHMNTSIGKAGRNRWLGRKPHNRGVSMNPIDHPHGGGEGRTSGGRHPGHPVGQADQGQEDPQQQVDQQIHSPKPPQAEEVRNAGHGSFSLERPVRRGFSAQEGRCRPRVRPSRRHQDLEPSLDDPAAVRRPDLRRLQRSEARTGCRQRGNGRSQVRRVLADPDLPWPLRRQESQEGLRIKR